MSIAPGLVPSIVEKKRLVPRYI